MIRVSIQLRLATETTTIIMEQVLPQHSRSVLLRVTMGTLKVPIVGTELRLKQLWEAIIEECPQEERLRLPKRSIVTQCLVH
jgi:hypothetical protein